MAACVVRSVHAGELAVGEQLPPATELAAALSVDRNTVLAAYRQLREAGILEFRRGRGARIAATAKVGDLAPIREPSSRSSSSSSGATDWTPTMWSP